MLRRTLSATAAAIAALTIYGCSLADSPTSPQTLPPAEGSESLLGSLTNTVSNLLTVLLVSCDQLPTATSSAVIGPQGGRINVGPHSLTIPKGALKSNVRITARIPRENVASVQLTPEGLKFAKPATLSMSYAHCRKLLPLPTRIVYTTDDLKILQLLESLDISREKRVTSPLDHFSKYAVAYRKKRSNSRDNEDGYTREGDF
jgi:hypothetical protein